MVGPGGGPPRRSHTKSRKGCETCKRRHIRCDENFPQCRNCTKHNCRCPYMDMPAQEESSASPDKPDLLWTTEIEAEIECWQLTGTFPFPELMIVPAPQPQQYSTEELRLLFHLCAICNELNHNDAGNFTIWTKQIPIFLSIGASHPFVMNALLSLSAMHLAWLTECPLTGNMAYEHRGVALKGLQQAIGTFSRQNSDAVLAASMLLSWQATEWPGWTQLMHGTSSVIDAMQPWKHESHFGDFIAEQSTFPTAPPSPLQRGDHLSQPRQQDLQAVARCYAQLQLVERYLTEAKEDVKSIQQLMHFVRNVQTVSAKHTAVERFEMLNPLRAWLFWLPVMLLQQTQGSATALVILSHYYAVALAIEPLFPEVGAAYFGSLSVGPIEQIARRLFAMSATHGVHEDMQTAMLLLEYAIDMVSQFRCRMGWVQPVRTASFPTFDGTFALSPYPPSLSPYGTPVSPYDTPAFAYSQEHLMAFSEAPPAVSPLSVDPFATHYLGIPSPGGFNGYQSPAVGEGFNGYQSPASSTFGDGSMIYSDGSDDFALFDRHASMGTYFHTVSPSSLKIEPCQPYRMHNVPTHSRTTSCQQQSPLHLNSPIILTPADFANKDQDILL